MKKQHEMQKLMEHIRDAHREFSATWKTAKNTALKARPPRDASDWDRVWEANGIAYNTAASVANRRNELIAKLFESYLSPLTKAFTAGDPKAIDTVLDFLEIDVPAFRCGYTKEWYLRKLKSLPLTEAHFVRLRQYTLRLCGMPHHRREIAELGRVMIEAADGSFIKEIQALTSSGNERVRDKSTKMLKVVLNGRKDLR